MGHDFLGDHVFSLSSNVLALRFRAHAGIRKTSKKRDLYSCARVGKWCRVVSEIKAVFYWDQPFEPKTFFFQ